MPSWSCLPDDYSLRFFQILNAEDFPAKKVSTIIGEFHGGNSPKNRLVNLGYQCRELGSRFIARR